MNMTYVKANLLEIFQQGSEISGVLDLPEKYWPRPGQYLPCQRVHTELDSLPINLFRVLGDPDQLTVGPFPVGWQPGERLACTPPQGHGFDLPGFARRVGLIPFQVTPVRLLSLVGAALGQGAEVAMFYDFDPHDNLLDRMPSQVEVLPLASLLENLAWTDYLAIDLETSSLVQFSDLFSMRDNQLTGEVLIRTAMPCRGLGECGVCAIKTRRGWRLACVDGPVFPVREVLHVAG